MGKLILVAIIISVAFVGYFIQKHLLLNGKFPPPPVSDGYFGAGKLSPDDVTITPFKISVRDDLLEDLNTRLRNTRYFSALADSTDFAYGFHVNYLLEVQKYWLDKYNWRKQEVQLNKYPQFKTEIEGIKVHFLHAKPSASKYSRIVPLLLVHGWPGSFYEFYRILPLLTDPKANGAPKAELAFEVIAPSIPGYGFSDPPKKKGFDVIAASRVFAKLMKRLKIQRYICQGGDWGSAITTVHAIMYPERVLGLHLNMALPSQFDPVILGKQIIGAVLPSLVISPEDQDKVFPLGARFLHLLQESGYMHIQATKPDTVGFALNDSPLGLAAYILEKFSTWTNPAYRSLPDGGLTRHWSLDELLTNVMIYWTTGSIASSQRFYKENIGSTALQEYDKCQVTVPTGVAIAPHELIRMPQSWLARRFTNITRYTDFPRGGHFLAFEEPKELAMDIMAFAGALVA
jgi:microsomal epoxide hydrolase